MTLEDRAREFLATQKAGHLIDRETAVRLLVEFVMVQPRPECVCGENRALR